MRRRSFLGGAIAGFVAAAIAPAIALPKMPAPPKPPKLTLDSWLSNGSGTVIDGGKITSGSITVSQLMAGSISADRVQLHGRPLR